MMPKGAKPKPSGLLINLFLIRMIPPGVSSCRLNNRSWSVGRLGRRLFSAATQHLDEFLSYRMVGPRILTSDELAIDNHVGLEINRPSDHLAASRVECVRHVEIHLRVKDVVFDPLFF